MKSAKIPDKDHVARYCSPKHISGEEIQATAFMLKVEEEYLSVNWLEYFRCNSRESEINELRKIYSKKLTMRASARVAVLNVGEVCEKVLKESSDRRRIEILHDPTPPTPFHTGDPSHSGIYNLRNDDEFIAELIVEAVRETHPARNL